MNEIVIIICVIVLGIALIAISINSGKKKGNSLDQTLARNLAIAESRIGSYTDKVQSGAGYILYDKPTNRILLNKEVINASTLKYYRTTENNARHYYLIEVMDENGVIVYKNGIFNIEIYSQIKAFFQNNLELELYDKTPQEIYAEKMETLVNNLGQPTKVINIQPYIFDKQILVFEELKLLFILGKEYRMQDILGCTCDDSSYVKKGDIVSTSTTKTSTGSMIGRAAIGGALLGTAGAVLGGATAQKDTTTVSKQGYDKTIHNYTVNINVDNLTSPVIKVDCGKSMDLANEIVGLINVIVRRNTV